MAARRGAIRCRQASGIGWSVGLVRFEIESADGLLPRSAIIVIKYQIVQRQIGVLARTIIYGARFELDTKRAAIPLERALFCLMEREFVARL